MSFDLPRLLASDALFSALLSTFGVLAAVWVVRLDLKGSRQQAAADSLIDWANGAGMLISDSPAAHKREELAGDLFEKLRHVRLDYIQLTRRLPKKVVEAISDPAEDLITMARVSLTRYPKSEIAKFEFRTIKPSDEFFDGTDHKWIEDRVEEVQAPLERFSATGRTRKLD
jgi:hypothetical protein